MKKTLAMLGLMVLLSSMAALPVSAQISHCDNNVVDADETGLDCGGAECQMCSYPPKGIVITNPAGVTAGAGQTIQVGQPQATVQPAPQDTGVFGQVTALVRGVFDVLYNSTDYVLGEISKPINILSEKL
jgi:hypothetical protein